MIDVLPAILADDAETLLDRLTFPGFWQPGMTAHIDILDGTMFGARCFCDPAAIARTGNQQPGIELHCMVQNPLPIIARWKTLVPQTLRAIIHAEIHRPLLPLFQHIRELQLEAGIALNPETHASVLRGIPNPDRVLLMGVHPGQTGQTFLGEPILAKIRHIHAKNPSLHICVDGGVRQENLHEIHQAGASSVVATTAIWGTLHPRESYEQLIHF